MTSKLTLRSFALALVAVCGLFAATAAAQETGIGKACVSDGDRPQITLNADSLQVMAGTRVKLTAGGGGDVEYMWHADNGRLFGRGTSVEFDTTGLAPGRYDVSVIGRARACGTTTLVRTVEVVGCPPDFRLTANNVRVQAGEVITVNSVGLPVGLSLNWQASAGRLVQNGATVTIDTVGLTVDRITVTAAIASIPDCTSSIDVGIIRPPVILPDILNFPMSGGRLNNANKAVLDDVSIRGGQDIRSQIVIIGRSSANERPGLARQRATNARNYLVNEKGVDPARIEIRTEERTAAEGGIEIQIIPPGAQMP